MNPVCENVSRYILPIYRSYLAKELIDKHGFTQVETATKLGTTQAAISQYIHSKRGFKRIPQYGEILPKIQTVATETAKRIVTEEINTEEIMGAFCELCVYFRKNGKIT